MLTQFATVGHICNDACWSKVYRTSPSVFTSQRVTPSPEFFSVLLIVSSELINVQSWTSLPICSTIWDRQLADCWLPVVRLRVEIAVTQCSTVRLFDLHHQVKSVTVEYFAQRGKDLMGKNLPRVHFCLCFYLLVYFVSISKHIFF